MILLFVISFFFFIFAFETGNYRYVNRFKYNY